MPVTATDRETAERVLHSSSINPDSYIYGVVSDAIAAALAEQRERHVADLERIVGIVHGFGPDDNNTRRMKVFEFCRERIAALKGESNA